MGLRLQDVLFHQWEGISAGMKRLINSHCSYSYQELFWTEEELKQNNFTFVFFDLIEISMLEKPWSYLTMWAFKQDQNSFLTQWQEKKYVATSFFVILEVQEFLNCYSQWVWRSKGPAINDFRNTHNLFWSKMFPLLYICILQVTLDFWCLLDDFFQWVVLWSLKKWSHLNKFAFC